MALVRLSGTSGGPILEQVASQPIPGDPDQKDRWLEHIDNGISQLGSKANLKEIDGVVLPGWAVLTKILRVSRIEGAGQNEVVRFEAESAMPSGLAGYEWTYSILQDDGFEREVLVQAVASELLESLLERMLSHGIRPDVIDGLISAQLTALGVQDVAGSGPVMLLDVGSRSVSLLVVSTGESPFMRNFSFGGSQVTQALAGQLGKPFAEAEKLKLEWVGAQANAQQLELLNQASEGFVTRLVNEVQRSLALFRRQGQAHNPSRILLTGGASRLPGLADFLERKTGIPSVYYDAFQGIASGPSLSTTIASHASHALCAPLGLGLRMLKSPESVPNLLPSALSSGRVLSGKKPWFLAAAGLSVLALLLLGLKFHWQSLELE
ncbi:MAG: pilus assembly protein PilM, partial [Verrucomicrobiae bacterium]|nr:pilus assembly protein PilM [Verrucomicrobiae bacterium]